MSGGDADDDSPDHDRRFDELSVTTEASDPDEASDSDEASDPDETSDPDEASDPDENIDAWEWSDPEPTPVAASGSSSPSETDHDDADTTRATTAAPSADPSSADTPEGDASDPRPHDRSAGESASTRDSRTRRTGGRIWNRSPPEQEDADPTEASSTAASTTPDAGASTSEPNASASTPTEGATPTHGDSTPGTDAPDASDAAPDASPDAPDESDATSDDATPADTDVGSAFSSEDAVDDADAESPTAGLDPSPGTSILLQCGSQDDREDAACHDLLGLERASEDRNVLLIQYRRIVPDRLEHIADHAARTTVVAVGYSQPVPESVADSVDTIEINNPNDITRLGILVSGTLDDWADHDATTVVCYDSVNVLLEYKDVQSTFRFLHVFLGTLESADAIAHFHADPLAGTPQKINTLKPLFDEVVSIDSMGVSLE